MLPRLMVATSVWRSDYLVDREEMVKKILAGRGAAGNDHPISAAVPLYADLPQRGFDPVKAKFHLEEGPDMAVRRLICLHLMQALPEVRLMLPCLIESQPQPKARLNIINVVREPNETVVGHQRLEQQAMQCVGGLGAAGQHKTGVYLISLCR